MLKNLIIFSLSLIILNDTLCAEPISENKKTESTDTDKTPVETEAEKQAKELKQKKEKLLRRHLNQFIPQNLTDDEKIDLLEEQLYKSNLRIEKLLLKIQHIKNDNLDFICKSFKFNNKAIRIFLHKNRTQYKKQQKNS